MPSTKRRGRRRKTVAPIGKEAWQILKGERLLKETGCGEGPALLLAQRMAQRDFEDPVTLTIRLKPLFGEPDEFYRVVREEDGAISTYRSTP